MSVNIADRFWARVQTSDGGECWPWTGSKQQGGYGSVSVRVDGRVTSTPAHRMAYTLAKGPIPAGLTIDHLCRNRACCNPAHLEAVTIGENVDRGWAFRAA